MVRAFCFAICICVRKVRDSFPAVTIIKFTNERFVAKLGDNLGNLPVPLGVGVNGIGFQGGVDKNICHSVPGEEEAEFLGNSGVKRGVEGDVAGVGHAEEEHPDATCLGKTDHFPDVFRGLQISETLFEVVGAVAEEKKGGVVFVQHSGEALQAAFRVLPGNP
jgi:hypothetical protein